LAMQALHESYLLLFLLVWSWGLVPIWFLFE